MIDHDDWRESFIEAITEVQNKLESKRSLFGKFSEYSNKLFTTPMKDLLTIFDITVAIEGETWTIYKRFDKKAIEEFKRINEIG